MKVNDLLSQARAGSDRRPSASGTQPLKIDPQTGQSSGVPSDDKMEKKSPKFPGQLQWLNPSYRQLAERRFKAAQTNSLPYIIAQQMIGGAAVFHDGSIAYEQILLKPSNTKMFGHEGLAWDAAGNKTKFFCILPGQSDLVPMGSVDEMFTKGLNGGEIGGLLRVNEFFDDKAEDEEEDPMLEAEWQAVSRASFYLLKASGEILPKDQRAAEAILKPLSDEAKGFAMANVMAMSAGSHELTLLKIALKLGFDPNQRSRLVEATPLEHAENKGNEKARQFLLSFRPSKY